MGDNDSGFVSQDFLQGFLNKEFGTGVQGRGGFIENEHSRILDDGARQADTLFFAAGKGHAPLSDLALISLGQRRYEIMNIGNLCRRHHLFHSGVGFGISDVFEDGGAEEKRVLVDKRDVISQRCQSELFQVDTVKGDFSGVGIIEAHHEIDQSGLAGAGGTDNSQLLFGAEL